MCIRDRLEERAVLVELERHVTGQRGVLVPDADELRGPHGRRRRRRQHVRRRRRRDRGVLLPEPGRQKGRRTDLRVGDVHVDRRRRARDDRKLVGGGRKEKRHRYTLTNLRLGNFANEAWSAAASATAPVGIRIRNAAPVSYTHLRAHETPE